MLFRYPRKMDTAENISCSFLIFCIQFYLILFFSVILNSAFIYIRHNKVVHHIIPQHR